MKKVFYILILVIFLIACQPKKEEVKTGLPNPAAKFCADKGFEYKIETDAKGSQQGFCFVQTGEIIVKCDEWSYIRGECPAREKTENMTAVNVTQPKLLVHFPWSKGETWTLTTNFHDENCLDFVNFVDEKAIVVAAADGEVLFANYNFLNEFNTYGHQRTKNLEDMGNAVILKHVEHRYTVYFHLQHETNPPVQIGEKIKAGTRIGYAGNTGFSHGTHLHFCVVDVSLFPTPTFNRLPQDSWGFIENNNSNLLTLNQNYGS